MADERPLSSPHPPPPLNIPASTSTVKVSIIDTTSVITLPMSIMCKPAGVGGHETCVCPAYSFLIEHSSSSGKSRKVVFDLGVRKDWENMAPYIVGRIKKANWGVKVEKDVVEILEEQRADPAGVEGIIWSHYHWDHTGDPARFPPSTALLVGPGVKSRFPPGYPTNQDAPLKDEMWEGREFRELDFSNSALRLGRFKALDYFGDGSFYLLDTPGHLLGHVCGLARTTAETFIFMGGDAAHHAGEFRPTPYVPLPQSISLDGLSSKDSFPSPCPGELLVQHIHPKKSPTEPFYEAADGFNEDTEVAQWTIDGLGEFDASEDVLMVVAHDASLLDVLDFYPESANAWKEKRWGCKGRWMFLHDFAKRVSTAAENK